MAETVNALTNSLDMANVVKIKTNCSIVSEPSSYCKTGEISMPIGWVPRCRGDGGKRREKREKKRRKERVKQRSGEM